jgi:methionyl-tRNA formyltransferase
MPDGTPVFATADGSLALLAVQPAGKREMTGQDWWRGRRRP